MIKAEGAIVTLVYFEFEDKAGHNGSKKVERVATHIELKRVADQRIRLDEEHLRNNFLLER